MIGRFFPSIFNNPNTDDCCEVPLEREAMIEGRAAKRTLIVCFIVNKTLQTFLSDAYIIDNYKLHI